VQTFVVSVEQVPGNSLGGETVITNIGNLSAIVFEHDKNQKEKYEKWADPLFEEGRQLRQQTYIWAKAWRYDDIGLYHYSEVPLKQLEGELIELTSELYPEQLLNTAGTR